MQGEGGTDPSQHADEHHFDLLADRYSDLREFAPEFLNALAFRSNLATAPPIFKAVELFRDLNTRGGRRLPQDTPVDSAPHDVVIGPDGTRVHAGREFEAARSAVHRALGRSKN